MISATVKGDNDKTTNFLKKAVRVNPMKILDKYGQLGVEALMASTPRDTGLTAESWYYEITFDRNANTYSLNFLNSNIQNGIRIAVILDVGHGTNNGGYVRGRNYIDPAVRPIFEELANAAWKEVTDA